MATPSIIITLRFPAPEYDALKAAATKKGMNVTAYVREAVKDKVKGNK